jgi:hypothetical protein
MASLPWFEFSSGPGGSNPESSLISFISLNHWLFNGCLATGSKFGGMAGLAAAILVRRPCPKPINMSKSQRAEPIPARQNHAEPSAVHTY